MCDADDNVYTIGNLMIHMQNHPVASKTENSLISPNQLDLSIDKIEPSFLTEPEDNSSEVVQLIKETNKESYYIKSPFEESCDRQPSPRCLNFTPYYEPSTAGFNCSSTPFHNAVPYLYPQSSLTSSKPVHIKNITQSEIIPNDAECFRNDMSSIDSNASENKPFCEEKNELYYQNSNDHLIREDSAFDERNTVDIHRNRVNSLKTLESDKINFDVTEQSKRDSHFLTKNATENCAVSDDDISANAEFIKSVNECNNKNKICKQYSNIDSVSISDGEGKPDVYIEKLKSIRENSNVETYQECKKVSQRSPFNQFQPQFSKYMPKSRFISRNFELYCCSECNYSSYNKSNFKNHLFIHSEKRRFACPYCTYKGKQSAGLRAHMKVHSIEKPFICSICNYRCKRKQNLIQHLRIHSKSRPYLCRYCDYGSTTKKSLQNHMMKHCEDKSDVREEMCKVKESEIKGTSNFHDEKEKDSSFALSHPVSTLIENTILNCSFCDFSTIQKYDFQNHVKTHKDNEFVAICNYDSGSEEKFISQTVDHSKGTRSNSDTITQEDFSISQKYKESLQTNSNKNEYIKCSSSNDFKKYRLQCPYCTFECNIIKYLKSHINSHSDEDFISFRRHSNNNNNDEIICKEENIFYDDYKDSENSHFITDYDDMKQEIEDESEECDQSQENVLQMQTHNSLHSLKWNFNRNKNGQNLKVENHPSTVSSNSEAKSKINERQNSSSQDVDYFNTKFDQVNDIIYVENRICQNDSIHEKNIKSKNKVKEKLNNNLSLPTSLQLEHKKMNVQINHNKTSSENMNISNTEMNQVCSNNISGYSNEINKTSVNVSANDNHEFCGFSNNSIEKCSEYSSSFLAKFDPLNIGTHQLSNSTPRTVTEVSSNRYVEFDSFDYDKNHNSQNRQNLSNKGNFKYTCKNSKTNENKTLSISENETELFKNDVSNILDKETNKRDIIDEIYPEKSEDLIRHLKFANTDSEIMNEKYSKSVNCTKMKKSFETTNDEKSPSTQCHIETTLPITQIEEGENLSKLFRCRTCDSSFQRKSSLVNHIRSHKKDFFQCSQCPITFRYRRAMQDHEKAHSKQKTFKCSKCDFSSMRKCSLMSHYRCHRKKFKCMHCDFECSLIKKMETHYLKHKRDLGQQYLPSSRKSSRNERH